MSEIQDEGAASRDLLRSMSHAMFTSPDSFSTARLACNVIPAPPERLKCQNVSLHTSVATAAAVGEALPQPKADAEEAAATAPITSTVGGSSGLAANGRLLISTGGGSSSTSRTFKKRSATSKYDLVKVVVRHLVIDLHDEIFFCYKQHPQWLPYVLTGGTTEVKVWLGEEMDHYYVLSRFLISQMLTVTRIPASKAIKIALDVKKHFVDQNMLEIRQSEFESVLFDLLRGRGYGDSHINCYRMVTQFYQLRQPIVIVICGAPWTGKSTIAQALAARLNMPNVMQTDVVHELLRLSHDAPLHAQPLCQRRELLSPQQLVQEYRRECLVMRRALDGDLTKTLTDGKPLIIEGLHLDPGLLLQDFADLGILLMPADPAMHGLGLQPEPPPVNANNTIAATGWAVVGGAMANLAAGASVEAAKLRSVPLRSPHQSRSSTRQRNNGSPIVSPDLCTVPLSPPLAHQWFGSQPGSYTSAPTGQVHVHSPTRNSSFGASSETFDVMVLTSSEGLEKYRSHAAGTSLATAAATTTTAGTISNTQKQLPLPTAAQITCSAATAALPGWMAAAVNATSGVVTSAPTRQEGSSQLAQQAWEPYTSEPGLLSASPGAPQPGLLSASPDAPQPGSVTDTLMASAALLQVQKLDSPMPLPPMEFTPPSSVWASSPSHGPVHQLPVSTTSAPWSAAPSIHMLPTASEQPPPMHLVMPVAGVQPAHSEWTSTQEMPATLPHPPHVPTLPSLASGIASAPLPPVPHPCSNPIAVSSCSHITKGSNTSTQPPSCLSSHTAQLRDAHLSLPLQQRMYFKDRSKDIPSSSELAVLASPWMAAAGGGPPATPLAAASAQAAPATAADIGAADAAQTAVTAGELPTTAKHRRSKSEATTPQWGQSEESCFAGHASAQTGNGWGGNLGWHPTVGGSFGKRAPRSSSGALASMSNELTQLGSNSSSPLHSASGTGHGLRRLDEGLLEMLRGTQARMLSVRTSSSLPLPPQSALESPAVEQLSAVAEEGPVAVANAELEDSDQAGTVPLQPTAHERFLASVAHPTQPGLKPLFVPVVLNMWEHDHRLVAGDQMRDAGGEPVSVGSSGGSAEGLDGVMRQAKVLQEYLVAYASQGVPVVQVRYGHFTQALDQLHDYVLHCIQVAMHWTLQLDEQALAAATAAAATKG